VADALAPLRASLIERLAALRGVEPGDLPGPLVDITLQRRDLPGGISVVVPMPADWEALREAEATEQRPIPWWARLWSSGRALARALADAPPSPGTRVLELGCGLALPSLVAARAGAQVTASDGSTDAVVFAAHGFAVNELQAEVVHADWAAHGEQLAALGPFDLLLAADVFYTRANVEVALALVPELLAPGGTFRLADPGRAGARDFLAAARSTFGLVTEQDDDVRLHTLTRRR